MKLAINFKEQKILDRFATTHLQQSIVQSQTEKKC